MALSFSDKRNEFRSTQGYNGAMQDSIEIQPTGPLRATIRQPGSKSITNRALVCAALARGESLLVGALESDDTRVMIEGLRQLGLTVDHDRNARTILVTGCAGRPPAATADLTLGNSGTTVRFLTAMATLGHGVYRLDGTPRMRERPVQDLLDTLQQLGGDAVSEAGTGCPPVVVRAAGLPGGQAEVAGNISSQFLSAVLQAAPCAASEVVLSVRGELVSKPYVAMTLAVMRAFGVEVLCEKPDSQAGRLRYETQAGRPHDETQAGRLHHSGQVGRPHDERQAGRLHHSAQAGRLHHSGQVGRLRYVVPAPQSYCGRIYTIEPDASAASYFFAAAAIAGGSVSVEGLSMQSLQGDVAFCDCLRQMGCAVVEDETQITVKGGALRGIDVDMNAISDTVQTLSAVALFAAGPTTIRNVAHIRHKETDRIAALAAELRKFGAEVEERADGLRIVPGPLHGATIDTYDDHRMAMSMALVGLVAPGVVIRDPGCTSKTYPEFFSDLAGLARQS